LIFIDLLTDTIHSLGEKCTNVHSLNDQMTRSMNKLLELTEVNSSKIRSVITFSPNDYKVNKLTDFVFDQQIHSHSTATKSMNPLKSNSLNEHVLDQQVYIILQNLIMYNYAIST